MLNEIVRQAIQQRPEYGAIAPVVEKEILHHDILYILMQQGVLQMLTFIGGTSLRLCYNSARLSEDLDFNAGFDFKPAQLRGLESFVKNDLERKYDMPVQVKLPEEGKQGNTSSWKVSITKAPNRPDLPQQKIHLDVCALPSLSIERRPLINHYRVPAPTQGLLLPVQTLDEMLVDKLVAVAFRSQRVRPRDIWDLVWLDQQGVKINQLLLNKKLEARNQPWQHFVMAINAQMLKLQTEARIHDDFHQELSRFLPVSVQQNTIEQDNFWSYVTDTVQSQINKALYAKDQPFPMS